MISRTVGVPSGVIVATFDPAADTGLVSFSPCGYVEYTAPAVHLSIRGDRFSLTTLAMFIRHDLDGKRLAEDLGTYSQLIPPCMLSALEACP